MSGPLLALRPFVPAQDFDRSVRYYQALGFRLTHRDSDVAMLKLDAQGFILQNFYAKELAENLMLQVLVRDLDGWWADHVDAAKLVADFGVKPPKPPAMQAWGMKVGFLFDPSGVLWHVAEVPF
jgi:catechol 2,3-dioxygenase-like lactoylglutathione lyase family enzyme